MRSLKPESLPPAILILRFHNIKTLAPRGFYIFNDALENRLTRQNPQPQNQSHQLKLRGGRH